MRWGYRSGRGEGLVVSLILSGYGIYLIRKGIRGETLMRGTTFFYTPRWLFFVGGGLLQLPLLVYLWFKVQG